MSGIDVVRFEVKGLNHAKLLAELKKSAKVFRVVSKPKKLTFECKAADKQHIVDLLQGLCYNYSIISENSARTRALCAFGRIGTLIGTVLALIAVWIYPSFIVSIVCEGTSQSEIASCLEDYGVKIGSFAPRLDCDGLEKALLGRDGVAFASVVKRGTVVYVTIKNELPPPTLVGEKGNCVASSCRASVTRVVVWNGTAVVKYGDVVEKGETLIAPYVVVGEEKVDTNASGEVFGLVEQRKTLFYPDTRIVRVEGEKKTYAKTAFLNKMPSFPQSPFENYTSLLQRSANDFLIPFATYRLTYTEIKAVEVQETANDEEVQARAVSDMLRSLDDTLSVASVKTKVERVGGGRRVEVLIVSEQKIGG